MAKGVMYIDGRRVEFDGEQNVLQVIRKAGIEIPTFCYYSELSVHGACRMCVVENEWGGIEASCSMEPRDQMKIKTNTKKLTTKQEEKLTDSIYNRLKDNDITKEFIVWIKDNYKTKSLQELDKLLKTTWQIGKNVL